MSMATSSKLASVRDPKFSWKLTTFEIHRRDDGSVKPYRTALYTPLVESAEMGVGLSPDENARRVMPSFIDGLGASAKVKPEEVIDFWENVAATLLGGGTEPEALVRSTRMASTARMRGILGVIRWRMKQGAALHAALAEFSDVFKPEQIALAEAGQELIAEDRGNLLMALATSMREQVSRGRKFWSTMLDQIISAVMLVILLFATVLIFAPTFADMFKSMGLDTPWPYQLASNIGQFIRTFWMVALPAFAGVVAAGLVLTRQTLASTRVQRFFAQWRITGPVVRGLALARSLPVFAVLHKSGAHPKKTFELAASSAGNDLVAGFFRNAYERCVAGETIEDAFMAERLTLGLEDGRRLAGKIEAGSKLGNLEGLLRALAREFSEAAVARIEALPQVIKPINYLVMGVVIAGIAALMAMPSVLALEKTLKAQSIQAKQRIEQQVRISKDANQQPHTAP
jgi:type II secretory pathway component PulF